LALAQSDRSPSLSLQQDRGLKLDVVDANVDSDNDGRPMVVAKLSERSRQEFFRFTQRHVGEVVEVLVDGRVVVAPIVREPQSQGFVPLFGSLTAEQAKTMAEHLKARKAQLTVRTKGAAVRIKTGG
jgi:preprotein translocase subunit SecD